MECIFLVNLISVYTLIIKLLFNTDTELTAWLYEFFLLTQGDFYQRGIENLVERWKEVMNNNGEYIIDQLVIIFQ